MPKKDASQARITRKEAESLYPDEWVVFSDARDKKDGTFKDGVVVFHGKDQAEAYKKSALVEGYRAVYYTGNIPYRKVTFKLNESRKAAA
jgi:hypothetical protein